MSNTDKEQTRRGRNLLPEPQLPEQQPEMSQQSVQRLGNCKQGQQQQVKKEVRRRGSVGQT